ncbi:MAG: Uma2 family endonuclease [Bryobacter sp.]
MAAAYPIWKEWLPATFTAGKSALEVSDEEFLLLCEQFPDAMVEMDAEGVLSLSPPTNALTGSWNAEIISQLRNWNLKARKGVVTDSSAGFRFPDGSRRSPDAAWVEKSKFARATATGLLFPVLVPDFVIELRSPSDRMAQLDAKMKAYLENGVLLGWLLDAQGKSVTIYRPHREAEKIEAPAVVNGEGPVEGFALELGFLWENASGA